MIPYFESAVKYKIFSARSDIHHFGDFAEAEKIRHILQLS